MGSSGEGKKDGGYGIKEENEIYVRRGGKQGGEKATGKGVQYIKGRNVMEERVI